VDVDGNRLPNEVEENTCLNCQNKYLDYGFFCVECDPFDPEHSNHEHIHSFIETETYGLVSLE
jgi:hypothetical protein